MTLGEVECYAIIMDKQYQRNIGCDECTRMYVYVYVYVYAGMIYVYIGVGEKGFSGGGGGLN